MASLKQLLTKVESLNGAQRRLGRYLKNDSSALLVYNVNDLAQAVGVSKATVVRFAKTMGYAGFPEFKRDIQKEMRRKLRAADRMKETFAELGDDENIFGKLIKRDIQLLQELQSASFSDFQAAVELILNARKVYLIGLNASTALAYILYFRLMRVKKEAHWIVMTGGASLVEQLAFMKPEDALVAIDFVEVPREVQTALQHAQKIGTPILGITDFPSSPIAKAAKVCLYAKRGLHSSVNSLTPAFSLVNALAIAVGWAKRSDSIKALTDLDILLEESGI
ncbi:MAG: MurR/RpiR family transcriptional regulator [Deltaproteobacteria bacterium]|nr:MurR/RpiR family transcriptional regulator [Deltaproteobacteria bacterium]